MKQKVKTDWLVFARGITIQEVNPESYALKTPYADNLFGTCLSVLPIVDKYVESVKIIEGFVSRAKMLSKKKDNNKLNKYEFAHTEGNAIVFSWNEYDPDNGLSIAKEILKALPQGNIHIIIYDYGIGVYRELDSRKILRQIPDEKKPRTI